MTSGLHTVAGALVAARDYLRRCANPDVTYGYYPGGDPRDFTPDYEVCTSEEIAAWQAACAAWERGERPDPGGPHRPLNEDGSLPEGASAALVMNGADGNLHGHATIAHYGMGSYAMRDEDAEDVLDQIEAALAALGECT